MTKRTFTQLEDQVASELDEPFRSRFLAIAYRVNHRLTGDSSVYMLIRDGWRNPEKQRQLYAKGRHQDEATGTWHLNDPEKRVGIVTNAPPGYSPHEYRRAAHVILMDSGTNAWLGGNDKRWHIIGEECKRFEGSKTIPGVKWGGTFTSPYDPAHIEDFHFRVLAKRMEYRGVGVLQRFEEELCPVSTP